MTAVTAVQQWDTYEVGLKTAETYENPFVEVSLSAVWTHPDSGRSLTVNGFYEGDNTWRIRFMPGELGAWRYVTESSDPALDGQRGEITCTRPTASYLHGPLRADGYHFVHADGTRPYLVSTRLSCHFSTPAVWEGVIGHLKAHRINRVLFIIGGMHGTVKDLYGEGPDFSRYNTTAFRKIDAFIDALRRADVIASPYFYYFNDGTQHNLTEDQDRAFIRYGMARFGAYANVMPCLSNEVEQKYTRRDGQYDPQSHVWANKMGRYLAEQAVFGQAVTVHNPLETTLAASPGFYTLLRDWPFPWADCMLRQIQIGSLSSADDIGDDVPELQQAVYTVRGYARHNQLLADLRRFNVPVVNEEPGYEMCSVFQPDELRAWNSQTCDTIVPTFWTAVAAGAYCMWGHSATYELGDPLPGIESSQTPSRLRILHDCISELPYWEMVPANDAVAPENISVDGSAYRTRYGLAKPGECYLVFALTGGTVSIELTGNGSEYHVTQLDPRTGERKELGRVASGAQDITITDDEQVLIIRR
jgi:hypothetical protein